MEFQQEDIPVRQFMDDPEIQWRTGSRPDYTGVRAALFFIKLWKIQHGVSQYGVNSNEFTDVYPLHFCRKWYENYRKKYY